MLTAIISALLGLLRSSGALVNRAIADLGVPPRTGLGASSVRFEASARLHRGLRVVLGGTATALFGATLPFESGC